MAAAGVDPLAEVRRLRLEIADEIAALSPDQWNIPSWCTGWRVRDVLGHLVHMAETRQASIFWQIVRNGFRPDRAIDRMAREYGSRPVPELIERLRHAADGRFSKLVVVPSEVGLGDLLVHSADALRPAGITPDPPIADVLVVLDTYKKWGHRVVHAAPHQGLCLVASDADWHQGTGPEVGGRAIDLLLLVANRLQVVDMLDGPGVELLEVS